MMEPPPSVAIGKQMHGSPADFRPGVQSKFVARNVQPHEAGISGQDAIPILAFESSQNLLKKRLTRSHLALFHELTGLTLHKYWPCAPSRTDFGALCKLCPRAADRPADKLAPTCHVCLSKQWSRVSRGEAAESRFIGLCGSSNYCVHLKGCGLVLLTLVVQQSPQSSRSGQKTLTQAARLMRLIRHDLASTLSADSASSELKSRFQTLTEPGHPKNTRPPLHSSFLLLAASDSDLSATTGTHRQQLVQRMLDFIHEHYRCPLQLHDLADSVNLNASYVSDLFSSAVGVTFHRYLEEYRLALARKLLGDPIRRVREVAYAVGYSNPNYFRNVFKLREGKSPSLWRIGPCSVPPDQRG